mmetsp:Transcript_38782/g.97035  ORF Transcript_38782/g.97035 Transcript_38782/m.97035 type:complete len:231 (-) Transcript_38782:658-1350(-)
MIQTISHSRQAHAHMYSPQFAGIACIVSPLDGCSRHFVVAGGHEWHLDHLGLPALAANLQQYLRANLGKGRLHISHGNGFGQRWREGAARHIADLLAIRRQDVSPLSCWRSGCGESDPLPADAILDLADNRVGTQEASLGPTPLPDGPDECGLHGCGVLVGVVAIQTQTRLQTQRIPCAKCGWLDGLIAQECTGQLDGMLARHGDLESVFSRVSASGDGAVRDAVDGENL